MTAMLEGRYFFPRSTRFVPARASAAANRVLRIEDHAGELLFETPAKTVRVSARLGALTRKLNLPNGAHFETSDNDGVDALLRALRIRSPTRVLDRIERSWRWVAAAVVIAILSSYVFIDYGVPAFALWLARNTPPDVAAIMSRQTLQVLDKTMLAPTGLPAAERQKAQSLFDRVAAHEPRGPKGYRLLFRGGAALGPNAFALPDGTIVMTDDLWKKVKSDDEIEGVFAHEASHVNHAHGLQRVYQASMIPAAIAVITGDVSQVSQIATILPGVVVQSAYSRGFEQQADDDAAALLLKMGGKPSALANLLERLDSKVCGKKGCPPSWLGSHPETRHRVMRLRAEEKGFRP